MTRTSPSRRLRTRIEGRPVELWQARTRVAGYRWAGQLAGSADVWTAPAGAAGLSRLLERLVDRHYLLDAHGVRGGGLA